MGRVRRLLAASVALAALAAAAPGAAQNAADLLMRLDSYEAELRRLTAKVEELEFQLRRQGGESDARIRDLEFRIVELEGGDPTEVLRGGTSGRAPPPVAPAEPPEAPLAPPPDETAGLAPGPGSLGSLRSTVDRDEQAAFDAAMADLRDLGPTDGQRSVDAYLRRFPEGRLAPDAYLALGEAFAAENRNQEAARQFLTGFRNHGASDAGPDLLLRLGETLGTLGRRDEACAALAEFSIRYPAAAPSLAARAQSGARRLRCS